MPAGLASSSTGHPRSVGDRGRGSYDIGQPVQPIPGKDLVDRRRGQPGSWPPAGAGRGVCATATPASGAGSALVCGAADGGAGFDRTVIVSPAAYRSAHRFTVGHDTWNRAATSLIGQSGPPRAGLHSVEHEGSGLHRHEAWKASEVIHHRGSAGRHRSRDRHRRMVQHLMAIPTGHQASRGRRPGLARGPAPRPARPQPFSANVSPKRGTGLLNLSRMGVTTELLHVPQRGTVSVEELAPIMHQMIRLGGCADPGGLPCRAVSLLVRSR